MVVPIGARVLVVVVGTMIIIDDVAQFPSCVGVQFGTQNKQNFEPFQSQQEIFNRKKVLRFGNIHQFS